jgi:hypothetical protein
MTGRRPLSLAILVSLLVAATAWADPDISGTRIISEPNGFPGVCDAPCYQVEKAYEVYLDGNPTAPGVCAAGENTFVYTLTHIGGNPLLPPNPPITLPVTGYEVEVNDSATNVSSAGFIPGPGVDPSSTTINTVENVVTWAFVAPPIQVGQSSDPLFICSPLPPGGVDESVVGVNGPISLDAPSFCVGPVPGPACDLEIDKTCCIPQPALPDLDICDGQVERMVLEYTGEDCSASTNEQGKTARCSGDPLIGSPADITVTKNANVISATPDTGIGIGDTVEFTSSSVEGVLKANTNFEVSGPLGDQTLRIHTSCSRALRCDDQFGAFKLVELETTLGGVVDCSQTQPNDVACTAPGDDEGTLCDAKVVDMVLEYQGQACQNPLPNPQSGQAYCDGDATGGTDVGIIYTGKKANQTQVSPASNVNDGDLVRVTSTLNGGLFPNVEFLITDAGGVLQELGFHTSCSQPLALGDEFGSFKLVEFTTAAGTTVALGDGSAQTTFDQCVVPLAPPKPHCTSELDELTLVYIGDLLGEGCSVSNLQGGGASCSGVDDPGDPVSVTVNTAGVDADPSVGVGFGSTVSLTANDSGTLPSSLSLDVTGAGGSQSLALVSDCTESLSLGDRFGSFVVFGMDRIGEGAISLGGEVEYQYTVTNPNASQADNVTVTDSELGEIVSGESIPAGGMKTFVTTATLFSTTANQAVVMGDVGGAACSAGNDSVTVDVLLPPPGAFFCADAQPFDELTLIWDGNDSVHVKAWKGEPGSTILKDTYFLNPGGTVDPGEEFRVPNIAGAPDDIVYEIFDATGAVKLGESKFHLSCSDPDMNGIEDCGKREGDSKQNDPGLVNDWLLQGMTGLNGQLDCTPTEPPPTDDCGLGPELMFLLPGLMWLHRRRLRRRD